MEASLATEVRDCLGKERTLYHYYPDQYAVYLLQRLMARESRVKLSFLRNTQWAGLLDRPVLRSLMAVSGDGYLDSRALESCWCSSSEPYVLTLGEWGSKKDWSWSQTSRPGKNLVLQLNLSRAWSRRFFEVIRRAPNVFFSCGHPVSETRTVTLAWARLDVDFDTDEVLIEEIQSDLIRDVSLMYTRASNAAKNGESHFFYYPDEIEADAFIKFSRDFLKCFKKVWYEVMLAASIEFVFDELGISNLYYHSFETGNTMKNLDFSFPPRSLYTDLPKKFCFSKVSDAPQFLQQEKRVRKKLKSLKDGRWFYMAA